MLRADVWRLDVHGEGSHHSKFVNSHDVSIVLSNDIRVFRIAINMSWSTEDQVMSFHVVHRITSHDLSLPSCPVQTQVKTPRVPTKPRSLPVKDKSEEGQ
eukprot:1121084-Amphidinium_carterae.1